MTNPFLPPGTRVDDSPRSHNDGFKSNLRPKGIVVLIALFFVFSFMDGAVLFFAGEIWWIADFGLTALLAFLFRKLWWGDERERRIAVFFGYFCAAILLFGIPDEPFLAWSAQEYINVLEGGYFVLAASYLAYLKRSAFFATCQP